MSDFTVSMGIDFIEGTKKLWLLTIYDCFFNLFRIVSKPVLKSNHNFKYEEIKLSKLELKTLKELSFSDIKLTLFEVKKINKEFKIIYTIDKIIAKKEFIDLIKEYAVEKKKINRFKQKKEKS